MRPREPERRVRDRQVDPESEVETNIGARFLTYGGGGHEAAGTCQIDAGKATGVRDELIEQIKKDG